MTDMPASGPVRFANLSFVISDTACHSARMPIQRDTSEEEEEFIFRTKPNIKINKHVNKVRKATGRAEAITAGRQNFSLFFTAVCLKNCPLRFLV